MDSISRTGFLASTDASQQSQNMATDSKKKAGGELGEQQFMTLLVTQLKNQDPLDPVDNTEFIAQLATFSSLEKLTSIESILKERLEAASSASS